MELPKTFPRMLVSIPVNNYLTACEVVQEMYPHLEIETTGCGYYMQNPHVELTEYRLIGTREELDKIDMALLKETIRKRCKIPYDWEFWAHGV